MKYRKLGRTLVDVSIIGLGAEYLEHAPRSTVISVLSEAMDNGVNYVDLFMASPGVRDNFGMALKGKRHDVMVAGHLGPTLRDGQYYRSRDKILCEQYFDDLLTRIQTDYIDVVMLHFVDKPRDYEKVFVSEGILELALRLKEEGKARFIGMSSHRVPVALQAVNSGYIDVLMFPVNPAFDILPGDMEVEALWRDDTYEQPASNSSESGRQQLYHACAIHGVAIVAMKPYAAGQLFRPGNPTSMVLTPTQCTSYALSQPGVCSVVPGCRDVEEMKAALAYLDATDEEKDYSSIRDNPVWRLRGSCMYCNHCLPCPASIDIGMTMRIVDTAKYETAHSVLSDYEALPSKASDCTECGVCVERCPFGVDVVAGMTQAVDIFGK